MHLLLMLLVLLTTSTAAVDAATPPRRARIAAAPGAAPPQQEASPPIDPTTQQQQSRRARGARPQIYGFSVSAGRRAFQAYDWSQLTGVGWVRDPALIAIAHAKAATVELQAQAGVEAVISDPATRREWIRRQLRRAREIGADGINFDLEIPIAVRAAAEGGPGRAARLACWWLTSPTPLSPRTSPRSPAPRPLRTTPRWSRRRPPYSGPRCRAPPSALTSHGAATRDGTIGCMPYSCFDGLLAVSAVDPIRNMWTGGTSNF
jgi:hypothetical protein